MKNYSALVDISWLSPTFAPHSVNQLRSLRIVGNGSESTNWAKRNRIWSMAS